METPHPHSLDEQERYAHGNIPREFTEVERRRIDAITKAVLDRAVFNEAEDD